MGYLQTLGSFRKLIALTVAALLGVALVTSACNDDDGGDDGSPDTATAALPSGATPAPTAGENAGEFEDLAAAYVAGADGRIVYDVDSDNFATHPVGTWTTHRLQGEVREDWEQNVNGYDEKSVAIKAQDGFYFCNQTPFTVSCTEEPAEASLDLIFLIFTPIKEVVPALLTGAVDYTANELPDETIAGEEASCYDLEVNGRIGAGEPGTEQIKMCFDDSGALLSMRRTVTFTDPALPEAWISVTAEDTGDSASADFDLPASPTNPAG
jgi:hypothetical protein